MDKIVRTFTTAPMIRAISFFIKPNLLDYHITFWLLSTLRN